jgi:signal transduction histidine kinase
VEDEASIAPKSRIRFLEKIVSNAERLDVLVEDLLTLSRLESKPDQLEPSVQSLKALAEDCLENYRTRIDPQTQSITLEFDERVGDFAFDRYRLTQVFDNLTENVFRYAPDFTCLLLKVELDAPAGLVLCTVQDDGPGIPEKDLPHIFERFYRVDKGRSRERGGTGLGLSIVKHIIQLHGGTVHAENVAPDPSGRRRASHAGVPPDAGGQATPESRRAQAGARIVFTLPHATTSNDGQPEGRTSA